MVTVNSPNEEFALTVEVDDPIQGYLIALWTMDGGREDRIGQTVVDDRDLALQVAAEMVAAADNLRGVHENPSLGPKTVHREDVERGWIDLPDEWGDEDQEEWEEALDEAFEKADVRRSKGTLTTKIIDDREYYYLQWREGEKIRSQYVAPVHPS